MIRKVYTPRMVLETWATDFIVNDQQSMFITTQDDPIQRRPKINYFNNDSVQNMIPIVSHISSNGYYGYCATPTTPSNNVLISVRSGIDGAGDIEAAGEIEIDDGQMDFQNTNDHTQHMADRSTERRKRCQKFSHDEELIAMKRCRNQTIDVEIGEGSYSKPFDKYIHTKIFSMHSLATTNATERP